jgi:hypothetical protein
LQQAIATAIASRDAIFNKLTADYHNDEDSIQRPGALREDMQGLGFFGQGLLTPSVMDYARRIEGSYNSAVSVYNAYVRSLGTVNNSLKGAGLKTLTGVSEVRP